MKKKLCKTFICTCSLLMAGLINTSVNADAVNESVQVSKVNLSKDFALGMDISSVIALENGGVTYYDENGNKKDIFKLCSENGTNYIRVRIWNNPKNSDGEYYGGGNNDLNTALKIGKRATNANMKLLIDLHYSDFWADPGKFVAPKDWTKLNPDEVSDKIYSWTKTVLNAFAKEKINVGMIQIGNEINNGFANERTWIPGSGANLNENYCNYINSGLKAVSDFNRANKTSIQKVLHFTEPNKGCGTIFSKLERNDVTDYDIFATSYYPEIHGDLENLYSILSQIGDATQKKVMVAETNYPSYGSNDKTKFSYGTSVQGQASYLRALINQINNIDYNFDKESDGVGVFYWEPAWPQISQWEKYGTGWASKAASDYLDINGKGYGYGQTPTGWISLFANRAKNKQQVLDSFKTYKYVKTGKKKLGRLNAVVSKNSTKPTLKWKKVSKASYYKIYRSEGENGIYKLIKVVKTNRFKDNKVKVGHTYNYSIKAFGKNGIDSSNGSTPISVYVPKKIKKLKVTENENSIVLNWAKNSKASGYIVYKSDKKKGTYKKIKVLNKAKKNKLTFEIIDSDNAQSFTGYYKVRAFYKAGNKKIYGKYSKTVYIK